MQIRVVDAFAERPFTGNPAAVCLLERGDWPDESWMRAVAAETNMPMTAFALPLPAGEDADWALRWFNTVVEEDLCGHATLATAHVLHEDGHVADGGRVRFATRSGVLPVLLGDSEITLDFPAARISSIPVAPALSAALGSAPVETFDAQPLRDVLAVFADEAVVRALQPDQGALAEFTRAENVRGVIATAPASGGYDFVSRFFSPADGLPEDPVTGSAHTSLAPYWAERLGRPKLVGLQVSARGGRIVCEIAGERVHLTGSAITVIDGRLDPRATVG